MTNNSTASNVANFVTLVIGVAFFAVTAVGISQPVQAAAPVTTAAVAR